MRKRPFASTVAAAALAATQLITPNQAQPAQAGSQFELFSNSTIPWYIEDVQRVCFVSQKALASTLDQHPDFLPRFGKTMSEYSRSLMPEAKDKLRSISQLLSVFAQQRNNAPTLHKTSSPTEDVDEFASLSENAQFFQSYFPAPYEKMTSPCEQGVSVPGKIAFLLFHHSDFFKAPIEDLAPNRLFTARAQELAYLSAQKNEFFETFERNFACLNQAVKMMPTSTPDFMSRVAVNNQKDAYLPRDAAEKCLG